MNSVWAVSPTDRIPAHKAISVGPSIDLGRIATIDPTIFRIGPVSRSCLAVYEPLLGRTATEEDEKEPANGAGLWSSQGLCTIAGVRCLIDGAPTSCMASRVSLRRISTTRSTPA